jgi:hypothetical protein
MNRTKASGWGFLLIAVGTCLTSGAASAEDGKYRSPYESVERMSQAGRYATGRVGRVVGNSMCGYGCGRAMERSTRYVYDRSRDAANRYAPYMQNIGRRIGRRVRDR